MPKPGYDKLIPAFQATDAGKGVQFQQSYGASGDQSRKVAAGAEADFVNFSVEPDITRLVDAGLVDASWNANEYKGIPFGSVVTIVVRKGNPKGIKDWDDLLQPGLEVVTPNPFSSGSAKWNLLAPYATKSNGGRTRRPGWPTSTRWSSDHVKIQPKSGREATEAFLQGSGDALLSYENEALFIEGKGDPVEHVTPPQTFKIENPTAVVTKGKSAAKAKAFNDYLFTPAAQELWAEAGFRPVDPTVAAEVRQELPAAREALDHRRPRRLEGRRLARCSRRTSATSPRSTTRPPSRSHDDHHPTARGPRSRPPRRRDRAGRHPSHPGGGPAPARARARPRRRRRGAVAQRHRAAAAGGADRRTRSTRGSPASGMP